MHSHAANNRPGQFKFLCQLTPQQEQRETTKLAKDIISEREKYEKGKDIERKKGKGTREEGKKGRRGECRLAWGMMMDHGASTRCAEYSVRTTHLPLGVTCLPPDGPDQPKPSLSLFFLS